MTLSTRLLAGLIAVVAGLVLAASASAVGPPAISGSNGDVWNIANPTPTYTITGSAPDAAITWTASNGQSAAFTGSGTVTLSYPPGTQTSGTLTATQTLPGDPDPGQGSRTFTVDTLLTIAGSASDTPPTAGVPTPEGWYRTNVLVTFSCTGHTSCSPSTTLTGDGAGQAVTGTASDSAGNGAQATVGGINIDKTLPSAAPLQQPVDNALTANTQPVFTWGLAGDGLSGTKEYEFWIDGVKRKTVPAQTPPPAGTRSAQVTLAAGAHTWEVRTIDFAGNVRRSPSRKITVDPSTPAAPTIVGGPGAFTNAVTPTFSWTGTGPSYRWELYKDGTTPPVQASPGAGPGTSATVGPLGEGTYTFNVVQINGVGKVSEGASRTFTVDLTAPGALTITSRPPSPSPSASPAFAWTGVEPAGVASWQVLNAGGAVVQGPANSLGSAAVLGPFGSGAYTFQLRQIDAAGNPGPLVSEPFTIAPGVVARPAAGAKLRLPSRNAKRLKPRAGRTLVTTRPVLRWVLGPRGTTSYNVQLFRVANRNAKTANALRLVKVRSLFPRGTQLRVKGLKRGQCYVWRVWPFRGNTFTKSPLGLSHFCIAKKKATPRKGRA